MARSSLPDLPGGFDVTDPALWAARVPTAECAELRRAAPIWWNAQPPGVGGFHDGGCWVVSTHADVKEVSRRGDVFSSFENTAISRFNDDITRAQIEMQRFSLINMDAPEHTRMRKLIAKGFTPRARSTGCARNCRPARSRSWKGPPPRVRATSSPRSPPSCPCRRSPS